MLQRVRSANAWVWQALDWRYVAAFSGAALVALLLAVLITSDRARQDAVDARSATATAATRRIDSLQATIRLQQAELELASAQRAELITKVDALAGQIQALGERPVASSSSSPRVTNGRTGSPTTSPTTTPTSGAPPTTQPTPTPQPQPQPDPQPSPCTPLPVVGCLEGVAP